MGNGKYVNSISAKKIDTPIKNNKNCPELPKKFIPVATKFGWVGSNL